MLICNQCEGIFNGKDKCPTCLSEDVEILNQCAVCENPILKDRKHRTHICLDCEVEIRSQIRRYVARPLSDWSGKSYKESFKAIEDVINGDV